MTQKSNMAIYPAVFTPVSKKESNSNPQQIFVRFPDIPGVNAEGKTEAEAVLNAKAALELNLYEEVWPPASKTKDVALATDEYVVMIYTDMREVVGKYKKVRRQITLPEVLAEKIEARGLSVSQEAMLGLQERLDKNK